jgi:plastocyanin
VLKLVPPLVVLCLAVTACGGGGGSATTASGGSGGPTLAVAADPSGALAYTEKTLTAKAGPVEIAFTNDSSAPHDVVVERDGDEVAKTDVVSSGKSSASAELTAGQYTFYCSVAGHRAAGMEGTLTVE